jgi:hypothetical protein
MSEVSPAGVPTAKPMPPAVLGAILLVAAVIAFCVYKFLLAP